MGFGNGGRFENPLKNKSNLYKDPGLHARITRYILL